MKLSNKDKLLTEKDKRIKELEIIIILKDELIQMQKKLIASKMN